MPAAQPPLKRDAARHLRARGERRAVQVAAGDFGQLGGKRRFEAARAGGEEFVQGGRGHKAGEDKVHYCTRRGRRPGVASFRCRGACCRAGKPVKHAAVPDGHRHAAAGPVAWPGWPARAAGLLPGQNSASGFDSTVWTIAATSARTLVRRRLRASARPS